MAHNNLTPEDILHSLNGLHLSTDDKTQKITDFICFLQKERAHLCHDANAKKARTRHLPPEILSLIFQYAAPPIDFEGPKYLIGDEKLCEWSGPKKYDRMRFVYNTLARVSMHWHDVVISTPQLWTSFAIKVSPRKLDIKVVLLRLLFTNSKNFHLDLKIKFKEVHNHHSQNPKFIELLHLFVANARRIRTFRLGNPPLDFANQLKRRLVTMEYLRISWVPTQPRHLGVNFKARSLRRASLKSTSRVVLPWSTITSLHLNAVPIDICAGILLRARCPNLIEYFCRLPAYPTHQDMDPYMPPDVVTFPHLTKFGWTCLGNLWQWNEAVFDIIHLPQLRTLYWLGAKFDEEDSPFYPQFFSHLSPTLETLHLEKVTLSEASLAGLLDSDFRPRWLVLEDCEDKLLKSIFRVLNPMEYGEECLPGLKGIVSVYTSKYQNMCFPRDPGVDVTLVNMLEDRQAWSAETLRINLMKHISWSRDTKDRMIRMARDDGIALEVYEHGDLVPWLRPLFAPRFSM
ncbi:hypothetical protein P691DRAFT_806434, partial [Macrolepiota fuliginosa MF-IS2]